VTGWLLDTNVISEMSATQPDARVEKWIRFQPEQKLFLSILTIAEYHKGIEHLPPGDRRRPDLHTAVAALEARFSGRVLSVSNTIILH
jgi:toxin FitB